MTFIARRAISERLPPGAGSLVLLGAMALTAIMGPWITPYDPLATDVAAALSPPSAAHWFGTDAVGRDLFSRVITATRLDVEIAAGAVALSLVIGTSAGASSGYFGGWVDIVIGRITDTIMAFPLFVLAMGIVAAAGNTIANIVFATAVINIPTYVRIARAEVLVRRDAPFILAARLAGNSPARLVVFQLLPNVLPPLVVQASLNMGYAILNAAGLSFIGLGVRPPAPEWGIMVADGAANIISGEWWVWLFPGLALTGAVLVFNIAGDGLRDFVDPKKRS
jgi:peptide/nickel transport system permease protein